MSKREVTTAVKGKSIKAILQSMREEECGTRGRQTGFWY